MPLTPVILSTSPRANPANQSQSGRAKLVVQQAGGHATPVLLSASRRGKMMRGLGSTFDLTSGVLPAGAVFTRASGALTVDSDGMLKWGAENIIQWSEDLSQWTMTAGSVVGGQTDPNGGTTAFNFIPDTTTGQHYAQKALFNLLAGMRYRIEVRVKPTGLQWIYPNLSGSASAGVFFDLINNVIGNTGGTGSALVANRSITDIGGGWKLVGFDFQAAASGNANFFCQPAGGNSNFNLTGDGVSGIEFWGVHIRRIPNQSSAYIQTGATVVYGARYAFDPSTGQPWGYFAEMAGTNMVRNSMAQGSVVGTPGTLPTNWVNNGVLGTAISVVGSGIENGVYYVDLRFAGTPTSTGNARIAFEGSTTLAALTGQTWTASVFARVTAGSLANITTVRFSIQERDSSGLSIKTDSGPDFSGNLGAALYRAAYTVALSGGATVANAIPEFSFGITTGNPIDVTFRIGLPQMEQFSGATSPILTSGATITRAQDLLSMPVASIPGWNPTIGGTFVAAYRIFVPHDADFPPVFAAQDGVGSNLITLSIRSNGKVGFRTISSTVTQVAIDGENEPAPFVRDKTAVGWSTARGQMAHNGTVLFTQAGPFTLPVGITTLNIGKSGSSALSGAIESIAYYPGDPSDAFVQQVSA